MSASYLSLHMPFDSDDWLWTTYSDKRDDSIFSLCASHLQNVFRVSKFDMPNIDQNGLDTS
jgi:hypothetical protein